MTTPCRIISVANPTAAAGIDPHCTDYRHSKFVRRRRYVEDVLLPQMARLTEASIFPAVTDADFTVEYGPAGKPAYVYYRDVRLSVGSGSTGNLLSHLMLWRECVRSTRPLLILEDDAELPPNNEAGVMAAVADFCTGIRPPGILHLLSAVPSREHGTKTFDDFGRVGGLLRLRSAGDLSGTAAYAINPAGAAVLTAAARGLPTLPTDGFIDRAFKAREISVYVPADYGRGFMLYQHFEPWNHVHLPGMA